MLSDPEKRARYDQFGHAGVGAGAGAHGGFSGFDPSVFGDFSDLFNGIFGFGGAAGGPAGGSDLVYRMEITFENAAHGVDAPIAISRLESCDDCDGVGAAEGTQPRTCPACRGTGRQRLSQGFLTVTRPCGTCRGDGRVIDKPCAGCRGEGRRRGKKELTIKIPAGVETGTPPAAHRRGRRGPERRPGGRSLRRAHGRGARDLRARRRRSHPAARPAFPHARAGRRRRGPDARGPGDRIDRRGHGLGCERPAPRAGIRAAGPRRQRRSRAAGRRARARQAVEGREGAPPEVRGARRRAGRRTRASSSSGKPRRFSPERRPPGPRALQPSSRSEEIRRRRAARPPGSPHASRIRERRPRPRGLLPRSGRGPVGRGVSAGARHQARPDDRHRRRGSARSLPGRLSHFLRRPETLDRSRRSERRRAAEGAHRAAAAGLSRIRHRRARFDAPRPPRARGRSHRGSFGARRRHGLGHPRPGRRSAGRPRRRRTRHRLRSHLRGPGESAAPRFRGQGPSLCRTPRRPRGESSTWCSQTCSPTRSSRKRRGFWRAPVVQGGSSSRA